MAELTDAEIEVLGAWHRANKLATEQKVYTDISMRGVTALIEKGHKRELVKYWGIADVIPNGEGFLLQWYKRVLPMTDEQLDEIYGQKK